MPQDSTNRKPYEPILLAASEGWEPSVPLPSPFSIFAVPREHSRKPSLQPILEALLGKDMDFVEVRPNCLQ